MLIKVAPVDPKFAVKPSQPCEPGSTFFACKVQAKIEEVMETTKVKFPSTTIKHTVMHGVDRPSKQMIKEQCLPGNCEKISPEVIGALEPVLGPALGVNEEEYSVYNEYYSVTSELPGAHQCKYETLANYTTRCAGWRCVQI